MIGRFALIADIARPNRVDYQLSEIKAWLATLTGARTSESLVVAKLAYQSCDGF